MSKSNKIKAVLFDYDGTIVNSMKKHVLSWKKAFMDLNFIVSDEFIYKLKEVYLCTF